MNTEINTTRFEFGCACVDSDARMCFERRYPKRNLDDVKILPAQTVSWIEGEIPGGKK